MEKKFEEQRKDHELIFLDSIDMYKPMANSVLCRQLYDNESSTTAAGLFKISPNMNKNEFLYQNSDRVLEVIKPPKELQFNNDMRSSMHRYCSSWVCDIDIKAGDHVWVWGRATLRNPRIITEEGVYDVINYFECIFALRESRNRDLTRLRRHIEKDERFYEVIPLNGNVLLEDVYEDVGFGEFKKKVLKEQYAKVAFVGKPNKYYFTFDKENRVFVEDDRDGSADIKPGNKVVLSSIRGEYPHPYVEDDLFRRFNGKKYFALQRQYIDAILN